MKEDEMSHMLVSSLFPFHVFLNLIDHTLP